MPSPAQHAPGQIFRRRQDRLGPPCSALSETVPRERCRKSAHRLAQPLDLVVQSLVLSPQPLDLGVLLQASPALASDNGVLVFRQLVQPLDLCQDLRSAGGANFMAHAPQSTPSHNLFL